jgi:hypothetical protein
MNCIQIETQDYIFSYTYLTEVITIYSKFLIFQINKPIKNLNFFKSDYF